MAFGLNQQMKNKMTTTDEFNNKYLDYLEEGYYGLAIEDERVVKYLDQMFEGLIKIPGFQYSQIKLKYDMVCFYTNLHNVLGKPGRILREEIEKTLNILIKY